MKGILLSIVLSASFFAFSQRTTVGRQSNAIDRMVQKMHYQPKPLDDTLSAYVFDQFIDLIDPAGYYFMQSDIDYLTAKHRLEIDNQIENSTSEFFNETGTIFLKRLKSADSLIRSVLEEPFDLTENETLSFLEEDYPDYVKDTKALKERWRKWLKNATLDELFDGGYVDDPTLASVDTLLMNLEAATKAVEKFERFEISSFTKHPAGFRPYLATFYLDALAGYYDPHTSYFSDIQKESFEEELSKDNYAYGFSLKENELGEILIAGLAPGSAAWMSNQMSKDDVLKAIKFPNSDKIDVSLLDIDELLLILRNSESKSMIMILKKANGKIEEVSLTKTEIYVDDDVIKSVILDGEKKIGYITLPDFYTDWDEGTGLGCANDIAKNIVKLKQEKIDGLILDLRNNGGGSLKEAIDLAGIFINYGPIAIEQGKYREPKSIKDMNKGAIYLGPFVILVNGLSASASEIFSAAMQDYNRAIIVGSTTYGKSTGQVVLPLDPSVDTDSFLSGQSSDSDMGYLKITRTKYYRITNSTHQKEGVIPNVKIRDYYELYDYAEANYVNALSKDKVVKKVYYTPAAEFNSDDLQAKANARLALNENYQELLRAIDTISNFTDYDELIPLDIAGYQKNEKRMSDLYDRLFEAEEYASQNFKVTNNKFDTEIMKMNSYRAELNTKYLEQIQKDLYIGEAYNILTDYINSK